MAEWQKCPICNGVGQVSGGFYTRAGDYPFRNASNALEICRTCDGKGVIIAPHEYGVKVDAQEM